MNKKLFTKTIVCYCRKYNLYFFRVGPIVPVKIELMHMENGEFFYNIVDGLMVSNPEKLFKKELNAAFEQFKKEINGYYRAKKLAEKLKNNKNGAIPKVNIFRGETDIIRKSVLKRNSL